MTNSILTTVYLNGVMQFTDDVELRNFLGKSRHQIWMITGDNDFDKILMQRIYEPSRSAIKHFESGHYISSIVMCGAVAEMLTYFLFFVHTNSKYILSDNSEISDAKYNLIKGDFRDKKDKKIKKSFGKKRFQIDRINILSKSKITKEECKTGGEGHDIKKICDNLRKINDIRI